MAVGEYRFVGEIRRVAGGSSRFLLLSLACFFRSNASFLKLTFRILPFFSFAEPTQTSLPRSHTQPIPFLSNFRLLSTSLARSLPSKQTPLFSRIFLQDSTQ